MPAEARFKVVGGYKDEVSANVRRMAQNVKKDLRGIGTAVPKTGISDTLVREMHRIEVGADRARRSAQSSLEGIADAARFDTSSLNEAANEFKRLSGEMGQSADAANKLDAIADKLANTADNELAEGIEESRRELDRLNKEMREGQQQGKAATKTYGGLVGSLKTMALGFVSGFAAIEGFKRGIIGSIQAAQEHEVAMRRLSFALEQAGASVPTRDVDDWAESLQRATGTSSDFIANSVALNLAMGATAEKAQDLTQAALDYAAATGRGAQEATQQIAKTLGGYAGELSEALPVLKALTSEQLKAGAAADIMLQKFGGAAAAIGSTGAGQLNVFKLEVEDAKQAFGDFLQAGDEESAFGVATAGISKFREETEQSTIAIEALRKEGANPLVLQLGVGILPGFKTLLAAIGRGQIEIADIDELRKLPENNKKSNDELRQILAEDRRQRELQLLAERGGAGGRIRPETFPSVDVALPPALAKEREDLAQSIADARGAADAWAKSQTDGASIFQAYIAAFSPEEALARTKALLEAQGTLAEANLTVAAVLEQQAKDAQLQRGLSNIDREAVNLARNRTSIVAPREAQIGPDTRQEILDREQRRLDAEYERILDDENTALEEHAKQQEILNGLSDDYYKLGQRGLHSLSDELSKMILTGEDGFRSIGQIIQNILVDAGGSALGSFIDIAVGAAVGFITGGPPGAAVGAVSGSGVLNDPGNTGPGYGQRGVNATNVTVQRLSESVTELASQIDKLSTERVSDARLVRAAARALGPELALAQRRGQ